MNITFEELYIITQSIIDILDDLKYMCELVDSMNTKEANDIVIQIDTRLNNILNIVESKLDASENIV